MGRGSSGGSTSGGCGGMAVEAVDLEASGQGRWQPRRLHGLLSWRLGDKR